jgi:glycosyltransferase involved in cell wall biosynthesis
VRFSATSVWDATNPWREVRECVLGADEDIDFDVLFLSGTDWRRIVPEHERPEFGRPIVNLVQHVRHGCMNDPLGRHKLLRHKAIRICVSAEVEKAIRATGRVRGPVFTIPDAIDVDLVARLAAGGPRDLDVLVAANKQPELGAELARRLAAPGRSVHLVDTRIPRLELVELMGRARATVLVPNPKEGFYLPALEAMAAGTLVVCPDCIGNRSLCLDGHNCFRPPYEEDAIAAAAERALRDPSRNDAMLAAARETARMHDIAGERRAFLEILDRVEELWETA